MTLVSIVAENDRLGGQLQAFGDALVGSAWWQDLSGEYGLGAATGNVHVIGPAITTDQDQASLVAYIQDTIADAGCPAPNGDTMYMVYLPDGINLSDGPLCAYHHPYPSLDATVGDAFGAVARCALDADMETPIDETTRLASHEIAESATDPAYQSYTLGAQVTQQPWTASIWSAWYPGVIEVGDLCVGSLSQEPSDAGPFVYQRIWSNSAADAGGDPCIPSLGEPYYGASAAAEWYPITAGRTLSIPITGWSTAPTGDWLLEPYEAASSAGFAGLANIPDGGGGFTVSGGLGNELTAPCYPRIGLNNGVQASVNVAAPATVTSGDYATIEILSYRDVPGSCNPPTTSDYFHFSLVGVYVQ
jgi:hypothetical protein